MTTFKKVKTTLTEEMLENFHNDCNASIGDTVWEVYQNLGGHDSACLGFYSEQEVDEVIERFTTRNNGN